MAINWRNPFGREQTPEQKKKSEEVSADRMKARDNQEKIALISRAVLVHIELIYGSYGKMFRKEIEHDPEFYNIGDFPRISISGGVDSDTEVLRNLIMESNVRHMEKNYKKK